MKASYYDRYIETSEFKVPIRIYVEVRRSVRVSLGKDHVILRVPVFAAPTIDKHIQFTKDWLLRILVQHPHALDKYQLASLEEDYTITLLGQYTYHVKISFEDIAKGSAQLKDGTIAVTIPSKVDEFGQRKMVRELISKIVSKAFKGYVMKRLMHINNTYFNKEISGLTLRYNATNWGSCSAGKKISLSTRALLLPQAEFEYIIVHELSHLIEMNHSDRFWKVVERVMPDYRDRERYIKENSSKIDF